MSSALTFYFKEIFPDLKSFNDYIGEYEIAENKTVENVEFIKYIYKVMFRRFHNSNVQYDVPDDFKCDLANLLEDSFEKYNFQLKQVRETYKLNSDDLEIVSSALANSSNNPNTTVTDPTKPLNYVGAQAVSFAKAGKIEAYLRAIKNAPTKLIDELLTNCQRLFKSIIPNQIYLYGGKYDNN